MASEQNPAVAPIIPSQNPTPVGAVGQSYIDRRQALVTQIMALFRTNLPSNYVSTVNGPFYTLQFQALAERIADFQITASEAFTDGGFDMLRSEYLWEMLGSLVFPASSISNGGIPVIDGDKTYRAFLRGMVNLLLMGATKSSVQGGVELLTTDAVTVIERFIDARTPGSEWTTVDTFSFDILVEGISGDPFTLRENVIRVLTALRPAHTLYTYANLLRDELTSPTNDASSWSMAQYGYEDTRRYCGGAESIRGGVGVVVATDRMAFTDVSRSFASVVPGATLRITGGVNDGATRRVVSVRGLRSGTDTTPRSYTTSPTGITGVATVMDGDIFDEDPSADFSPCVDGETITFSNGPNAGTYRIAVLLGNHGGVIAASTGPCRGVRVAPCTLVLDRRLTPATGQTYSVDVDRLGIRTPQVVTGEDASIQFWT